MKNLFIFILISCATVNEDGKKVIVESAVPSEGCENLGPVTVNITVWGLPSESLAVLRNKVARMRGNTLVQTADHSGIAYYCDY